MAKLLPVLAVFLATFVIFAHSQPIVNENAVEQRPTRLTLETANHGAKKDEMQKSDDPLQRSARHFGGGFGGFGGGFGMS